MQKDHDKKRGGFGRAEMDAIIRHCTRFVDDAVPRLRTVGKKFRNDKRIAGQAKGKS